MRRLRKADPEGPVIRGTEVTMRSKGLNWWSLFKVDRKRVVPGCPSLTQLKLVEIHLTLIISPFASERTIFIPFRFFNVSLTGQTGLIWDPRVTPTRARAA